MIDTSRVDAALRRSQDHLLGLQSPAGDWVGELEADSTITSEYVLLRHLLGTVDRDLEDKAVAYLRDRQGTDGSWNLYQAGAGDLSATIKAYFAMKMARVSPVDPAMARAREWILEQGGPTQANVFTKITLALFGQYPWGGVPAMPVEIMLLPRWSYFNVWEISYWSRTVLIPLLIVMDRRPVHPVPRDLGIDELWAHHLHLDDPGICAARARVVEERLHRRRRVPQDVGGLRASPLAGPGDPCRPRLAGAPDDRPGRPGRHLSRHGERDPGDAAPGLPG